MEILGNVLLAIVSICTFFSYFPQIVKCLKTKKGEDLSVWSWILWVVSSLAYTLYAILCTGTFMLIFETSMELLFCVIILTCAMVFRNKKSDKGKEKMKVVTICGSMRFEKEMIAISRELEMKDFCVLQCVYGFEQLNEEELAKLARLHYKKIDISDAIYVVNVGGYIGESVKKEIDYAKAHGKEIIYHEN